MADKLNDFRASSILTHIPRLLLSLFVFPLLNPTDGRLWKDRCIFERNHSVCLCDTFPYSGSRICRPNELLDFQHWDFEDESTLTQSFPIDKETRNYERQVNEAVFSTVRPVTFRQKPFLIAVSMDAVTEILDMKPSVGESRDFIEFVAGNNILPNSVLLSHRYGGHQFGEWAGQLGDGRAVLLGEYINRKRERWELQLKGSGKTPYSRRGDGRAVLRSSVREFLASEAMFYLGIPTSRAAALVGSSDRVWRDPFYDGHPMQEKAAVVLRLARSWFRIGSLEILTSNGEHALLRKVVNFIIEQYFPDIAQKPRKYVEFFSKVVTMTADMIARWQSVGFAHGVCNTDNFSLLSVTIDYGPFGFMDDFNQDFIPNTSDEDGRYSYKNQPNVGFYNMEKLLHALRPLLIPEDYKQAQNVVLSYVDTFNKRFLYIFRQKLGLLGEQKLDEMLIRSLLWMMEVVHADFTMTFRELSDMTRDDVILKRLPAGSWALARLQTHDNWEDWLARYAERIQLNGKDNTDRLRRKLMYGVNPRYVLRNWMAQSAIEKADRNDFSEVQMLLQVLKRPFTQQKVADDLGYSSQPPAWASRLRVSCSS